MLKLGSIYPRYVGPRLIIPGVTLDGGMLDLLHWCIFLPTLMSENTKSNHLTV